MSGAGRPSLIVTVTCRTCGHPFRCRRRSVAHFDERCNQCAEGLEPGVAPDGLGDRMEDA
jgi:hypothetical protein